MIKTIFKAIFHIATLLCGLLVAFGACVDDTDLSGSCDHKTRCLNNAISCLTGEVVYNKTAQALFDQKLRQLEKEVATLKVQLAKAGQPGGFATLDDNGRVPQKLLPGGFDQYSAYDLGWQSLHMAAAAACRGSTPTGGSGCCQNPVLVRNTNDLRTCRQICAQSSYPNCDAEVSVYGKENKATQNGEIVGWFYNYKCDSGENGGSEASTANESVMGYNAYFGFCCCRK